MKTEKYYYYVKELQKWEDRKRKEGSNYVTDQYIEEYSSKLAEMESKNKPFKKDKSLTEPYVCSDEEWEGVVKKRIKSLKRRIDSGKAGWVDYMLYDLWRGKDIKKIKYFSFEKD